MPGTTQFFTPPSSFTASSIPISAHGTTITYADGSKGWPTPCIKRSWRPPT